MSIASLGARNCRLTSAVQAPANYGRAVNFKAAKALGLEVPPTVPAHADKMIE
jgi:hypothetical protein